VTVLRFNDHGKVVDHRDYDNHVERRKAPYAGWRAVGQYTCTLPTLNVRTALPQVKNALAAAVSVDLALRVSRPALRHAGMGAFVSDGGPLFSATAVFDSPAIAPGGRDSTGPGGLLSAVRIRFGWSASGEGMEAADASGDLGGHGPGGRKAQPQAAAASRTAFRG